MDNSWSSNGNSESEEKSDVKPAENNENNLKNISPYMSKDLIAAAGFNVETPIVNAIIGNLTGSLPTKKNETEMIKCEICDCELSSNIALSFHINGSRHKKRVGWLKALEIIAQLKEGKDTGVQLGDSENPNAFRCEICSLTVNSAQQLQIHLSGGKHKKKAAKAGVSVPLKLDNESEVNENAADNSPPAAKKKKKDEPTVIPCDVCNIFMNSQTQYDQHLLSKRHLSKVSGNQQQRKIPGKGKFIKFPPVRGGGNQFPMNSSNQMYHNEPNQFKYSIYNRLFPYSNFITKNHFYCKSGDNTNSFRQSPATHFQKRF